MGKLLVIVGPTAIGKTDLSIELAKHFKAKIISGDSRQIYKELEIGTAVPSKKQLNEVQHYFIQHKSVTEYYNASMFEFEVIDLLQVLFQTEEYAVLVGGSGMYVDAVCRGIDDLPTIDPELRASLLKKFEDEGINGIRRQLKMLDPAYYNEVDLKNPKRILKGIEVSIMTGKPYSQFRTQIKKVRNFEIRKAGLTIARDELYDRINKRVDMMIKGGLVDEARSVHKYKHLNSLNTVGYKELFDFFDGKITLEKAIELIKRDTRRFAKRQLTWFKRDKDIKWFHPGQVKEIIQYFTC